MKPVPVHWVEARPRFRSSVKPERCLRASSFTGVKVRLSSRRFLSEEICFKPSPWMAQFARSILRRLEIFESRLSQSSVTRSFFPPLPLSGLLPL